MILAVGDENKLDLLNIGSGDCFKTLPCKGGFSKDGRRIICGAAGESTMDLFDEHTGIARNGTQNKC